ncbi:MAG TPA: hypothetical protein PLQ68_04785 [Clostridia bacterium]|nr:hypothetical protein [Clostridia bacterium]
MKKILCILLIVSMMLILCACDKTQCETPSGIYSTKDNMSNIHIYSDGTFTIFHIISSRIITGEYKAEEDLLVLTDLENDVYKFNIEKDRLIFLSTTAKYTYFEEDMTYYAKQIDYENIQAAVYYGFSSYALFTDNDDVVKELYDGYYNMKTQETDEELDFPSAFLVVVGDVSFFMDKNGCIRLNDNDYIVKDTANSISYARLKEIYNDKSLMMGED